MFSVFRLATSPSLACFFRIGLFPDLFSWHRACFTIFGVARCTLTLAVHEHLNSSLDGVHGGFYTGRPTLLREHRDDVPPYIVLWTIMQVQIYLHSISDFDKAIMFLGVRDAVRVRFYVDGNSCVPIAKRVVFQPISEPTYNTSSVKTSSLACKYVRNGCEERRGEFISFTLSQLTKISSIRNYMQFRKMYEGHRPNPADSESDRLSLIGHSCPSLSVYESPFLC